MSFFAFSIILYYFTIIHSFPSCKENQNLCIHCNSLTYLCAKCEKEEILVPDKNGGCIGARKCQLGKNYCLECDTEGQLCKKCEENYYPDENGGCSYSDQCEISYLGECLQCKVNYALIGREGNLKVCKSILSNDYKSCKEINYETGFCNECEEGYFLTSEDHKCIKTENCKESIFGNCISCDQNYYFNKKEDKCEIKRGNFSHCKQTIDGINCDICDESYFPDADGICVNSEFCLESTYFICQKCQPGYFLSDNHVCTKTDNCYVVDKVINLCSICKDDYYLDTSDYKCKSNLEDGKFKHCRKVVDDECIQCRSNYYLGEDSKCSESSYCSESENGVCISCISNYYLGLDHICTNIEKCIYSKFGVCTECEDGYYYNKINLLYFIITT